MKETKPNLFVFVAFFVIGFISCKADKEPQVLHLKGTTMGTFYDIKFETKATPVNEVQNHIDSLLDMIHVVASTYQESSLINQINEAERRVCFLRSEKHVPHLVALFDLSEKYVQSSHGYFDPTSMPLIRYWGYAPGKVGRDTSRDAFLNAKAHVGWNKIKRIQEANEYCISKEHQDVAVDFNAIAKGYGVDMIADLLEARYSQNYLVNIGGELRVKGSKGKDNPWRLGVNIPDTSASINEYYASFDITNCAIASSGNYRDYKVEKGNMTVHTIDPISGLASPSNLLSITVITNRCAHADAIATACMAMGKEKAEVMLGKEKNVKAILIYKEDDQFKHKLIGELKLMINAEQ